MSGSSGLSAAPREASSAGMAASGIVKERSRGSSSSVVVEAARQHKTTFAVSALVILLLIAGAGYGLYALLHGPTATPAPGFQNFSISQITNNAKSTLTAISPDGKYLLSELRDAGKSSLWLRQRANEQRHASISAFRNRVSRSGVFSGRKLHLFPKVRGRDGKHV